MEIRRGKNIACTIAWGVLLLLVRMVMNRSSFFNIPFKLQLVIAIFFMIYGFTLAFWEIKNNRSLFWGAGNSVFNIGMINSSLIVGVSVFFFASNAIYGLCAFGIEITLYVFISIFDWE
ncbi:hypothetical protein [Mogibacterium pumilum]|uniref:Transporter n=1 Tax=Mogibacterium pumilum TaxID=86332 RepID=A0A223ARR2_9FIRM|nr:hypothetical protein [Mogibacterium pumilum]ASS37637.1 hypothetical protein AXF17_03670 [Mogibacterium pumilum]